MAFQNNPPVTQILVPSNGTPGKNTGTTVIGGDLPQLVKDALGGSSAVGSGIVWYSSPSATGYDYLFLAVDQFNGRIYEGFVYNGVVYFLTRNSVNGFEIDTGEFEVTLPGTTATFGYSAASGLVTVGSADAVTAYGIWLGDAAGLHIMKRGSDSYIADTSPLSYTDKWPNPVNGPGPIAFNGGTYSTTYQRFISFDRMVTFTWTVTFSVLSTAGNLGVPNFLPTDAIPMANAGPVYGSGTDNQTGPAIKPIVCRVDPGSRTLSIFTINGTGVIYKGSVTYPIDKPGF